MNNLSSQIRDFSISRHYSGEAALQDWSSEEAIAQAEKSKELSPLGGVIFRKFMKSSGDLGDKVGLALYMEGIIRFSKLRQGELCRGEKALPRFLPKSVKTKILSLFSLTSGGRSRVVTPDMKDKAVCHIMVLALLINSLKLGNVHICSETKYNTKQLVFL